MPNKKPKKSFAITPVSVSLTETGDLESDSLLEAAAEVGISPDDLLKIFKYTHALKEVARDMDMEPTHVMTALLNAIGELIVAVFPTDEHPDICTDIFHQLWRACDLPSDTNVRE